MPTFRSNRSDDLVLKDGNIGINSSSPTAKLDVVGYSKGINANVTGVATFSSYAGYLKSNQNIVDNRVIKDSSSTLSGEIIVGSGKTLTVSESSEVGQGNILSLKVSNTFNPPIGGTNERPSAPQPGALYYNKDFRTIEYWDGKFWRQVDNVARTGRAVWMGGNETHPQTGSQNDHCSTSDYVQIHTLGNAIDFGTLDQSTAQNSSYGSSIEVFSNGFGQSSTQQNYIQNAKFASGGNFQDFGDLTRVVRMSGSGNSSTRGVTGGGAGPSNVIDYLELQTKGNSLDFGDLSTNVNHTTAVSSAIRIVMYGGAAKNEIQYHNIMSTGDFLDFGNLTEARGSCSSASNGHGGL